MLLLWYTEVMDISSFQICYVAGNETPAENVYTKVMKIAVDELKPSELI